MASGVNNQQETCRNVRHAGGTNWKSQAKAKSILALCCRRARQTGMTGRSRLVDTALPPIVFVLGGYYYWMAAIGIRPWVRSEFTYDDEPRSRLRQLLPDQISQMWRRLQQDGYY